MDIYDAVPPKTNWWSRNWRWFVPLLIISNIAILVLVLMIFKTSGAYQLAVETIKDSPLAQEKLGTPIEESIYVFGSIESNSDSGHANLYFSVRGPKDSASVNSNAHKTNGAWVLELLEITINSTQEKIDLLLEQNES